MSIILTRNHFHSHFPGLPNQQQNNSATENVKKLTVLLMLDFNDQKCKKKLKALCILSE